MQHAPSASDLSLLAHVDGLRDPSIPGRLDAGKGKTCPPVQAKSSTTLDAVARCKNGSNADRSDGGGLGSLTDSVNGNDAPVRSPYPASHLSPHPTATHALLPEADLPLFYETRAAALRDARRLGRDPEEIVELDVWTIGPCVRVGGEA